jgi:hypothetical protein
MAKRTPKPKPKKQPIAEAFGFPINNITPEVQVARKALICPFNNRSIKCTKDKVEAPIGTCSIFHGINKRPTITCPVRFRENWLPVLHAADFLFPAGTTWIDIREVKTQNCSGKGSRKY